MSRKPFNLEDALDGKPVETLNGYKVRVVYDGRVADDGRSVIGLVKIKGGEQLRSFHPDGRCGCGSFTLYMSEVETGGWVNIYKNRTTNEKIYGTKQQAINAAGASVLTQVHVKWKE